MIKKVLKKQKNARFCFVCGVANNEGLHSEFYELDDGTIAATTVALFSHQSYPGRVHGGVSTALLDETIGRAINITEPETWGVTVEINMRFKKPLPYNVPLLITGRITENKSRLFAGEGRIILPDGSVAAIAAAKYMKMKLTDIADFDANHDSWELYPRDDDPIEFDIPE
jgi:acyl-coenzyme A thioesterase PaaI-like protein